MGHHAFCHIRTGKSMTVSAIIIYRLIGGKIAEQW